MDRPETEDLPEHVRANIAYWDGMADQWVAAGERAWVRDDIGWGQWHATRSEVRLLPEDCTGLAVVELGCGTGYVSGWAVRLGATRVLVVDTSAGQLRTARRLAAEHGADGIIEFVEASAEDVPAADATFDHVVSEYGAATWCDPDEWVREAWRLLRPGGTLSLLTNHHLVTVCSPVDGSLPVTEQLERPWFGDRRFDWRDAVDEPGGIEYSWPPEEWITLLLDVGFVVTGHATIRAPDDAEGTPFAVTSAWSQRFPSEMVFHARRPA